MDRKAALIDRVVQLKRAISGADRELQTWRLIATLADQVGPAGDYSRPERTELRLEFLQATRQFIDESNQTQRTQRRKLVED